MWWMILGSEAGAVTLEEAWAAAEAGPELASVGALAERSRADLGAARAALVPKLQVQGTYTWADEPIVFDLGGVLPAELLAAIGGAPPPITVQEQDWFEASASLAVPLVDADAWWTLRAASLAAEAAGRDVQIARRALQLGVARVFHGAGTAREGVAVAEQAVALARTVEDVARRRVEAGDAPPRTLLEAEQGRLSAERDLLAAREQLVRAEEALRRLTGLPPGTPLDDAAPASDAAPRPERAAAEARLAAATAARVASRAAWVPDVTAQVRASVTENEGFAPDGTFVYAGATASFTFDGGYRSSRARAAGATVALAEAQRTAVDRQLAEERAVAAASRERAVAAEAAAARELAVAEARLGEAELAFRAGVVPYADLERAALGRRAAALAVARERHAAALADVELALAGP
jgi:outer membrane protein TolC